VPGWANEKIILRRSGEPIPTAGFPGLAPNEGLCVTVGLWNPSGCSMSCQAFLDSRSLD
jgi:hypothetical protein